MVGNPIHVGIIGVHPENGWPTIAHKAADERLLEYRVTTISSNRVEVIKVAAEGFGIPHADTNETLVNDPGVGVVVAVTVTQHRELAIRLLEAGKIVFCEWPPEAYGATRLQEVPSLSVGLSSPRPVSDLRNNARLAQTLDGAVDLQSLINAIECSEREAVDV
ncbi:Gfo/Idh/MocA family oxidoreductase [Mesorhizobium sp. BR1-1-3]|uniref:Gfo/Idh/MocA family oxidoreductase n=1 Tax=Mesorhizobium sp. BR1-1-3 TaxID=2876651 RepID=UPI001CD04973|nr:Gfo/Idh/MocA family oxidoreductase [Mesorhizobium sp. BR1-1-3]MBZ9891507.1 Gfo/Idh/MocA family oxidoreductase [Mesorhizobium sp. BR1-1-3]